MNVKKLILVSLLLLVLLTGCTQKKDPIRLHQEAIQVLIDETHKDEVIIDALKQYFFELPLDQVTDFIAKSSFDWIRQYDHWLSVALLESFQNEPLEASFNLTYLQQTHALSQQKSGAIEVPIKAYAIEVAEQNYSAVLKRLLASLEAKKAMRPADWIINPNTLHLNWKFTGTSMYLYSGYWELVDVFDGNTYAINYQVNQIMVTPLKRGPLALGFSSLQEHINLSLEADLITMMPYEVTQVVDVKYTMVQGEGLSEPLPTALLTDNGFVVMALEGYDKVIGSLGISWEDESGQYAYEYTLVEATEVPMLEPGDEDQE